MSRRCCISVLVVLVLAMSVAWAQDDQTLPTEGTQQGVPQSPAPVNGQDNQQIPMSENPPLSGLDLPSLEPHSAPLSYLQPGATVSESADSNVANLLGGGSFASVTR